MLQRSDQAITDRPSCRMSRVSPSRLLGARKSAESHQWAASGYPSRGRSNSPDLNGGRHAAYLSQELSDPSGSAAEHQQAVLVHHHRQLEGPPVHPEQYGTSYDIGGFARPLRMASHPPDQGTLTSRHPNGPPKRCHLISEIASTPWQTTTSYASASSSATPVSTGAGRRHSWPRRSAPARAPSTASSAATRTSALR